MGGIAGAIALFVVAGTFGLAIAQRRRETAVLRALGATSRQVRRLISGEALIVSLIAGGLGLLAGAPLADAIAGAVVDHGVAPQGFAPGNNLVPLVAALGMGIGVAQLAVIAAARRAGRIRPAEALREVAVEHARPGSCGRSPVCSAWRRRRDGAALLGRGGERVRDPRCDALRHRRRAARALAARAPDRRARLAAATPRGAGAARGTSLAANRWRSAALATPIVLIAMLVGTQGVLQASDQRNTERVTAARVTADHVVVGRDGAPLPAGTAGRIAGLPGVERAAATLPTELFLLDRGLAGWDAPWQAAGIDLAGAAGALDLRVVRGDIADVHGDAVAVSDVVATEGDLEVGDTLRARMADTRAATLRVAAVYERAAGLGHIVLDPAVARRHAAARADGAVFVNGGAKAARSLARYAGTHPGVSALSRSEYLRTTEAELTNDGTWGVWLVIGLSLAFAVLALLNTAAMATTERRGELATIRLLGGTRGQATRMIALELAPTVAVALLAGAAIAVLAVIGVPEGVRGIPLVVPAAITAALLAGSAVLALAAGVVTARIALRATPASAMRAQE